MKTEITTRDDGKVATVNIYVSQDNLAQLQREGQYSNGVVILNGELLTPFANGLVNVAVEDDATHYADPIREQAKQKIREARSE